MSTEKTKAKVTDNAPEEEFQDYKHLIRTTGLSDRASYGIAPGYTLSDLTGEERYVLSESYKDLKNAGLGDDRRTVQQARMDFRRLAAIPGLPQEAMLIVQDWLEY